MSLDISAFLAFFAVYSVSLVMPFVSLMHKPLLIYPCFAGVSTFAMFMYWMILPRTFLADFPERCYGQKTCFLFFACISPINIVILLVSYSKVRKYRGILREETHRHISGDNQVRAIRESVEAVVQDRDLVDELREAFEERRPSISNVSDVEQTVAKDLPTYGSSPNAGRAAYIATVESGTVGSIRQKQEKLESDLVKIHDDIVKSQQKLNKKRSELAECNEFLARYEQEGGSQNAEKQFENLLALDSVLGVEVVNNKLRLIVRCQATVGGKLYDLGDWRISVKPDSYKLKTKLLRDGRTDEGYDMSDPPHINEEDDFCFGATEDQLEDLLRRGKVFAAIVTAIDHMCQTLPGREREIPIAFKEVI